MQDRTLLTRKDAPWLILREAGYEFTGGAMPSIFLTEGEAAPIIERNASWKGLRGKDKKEPGSSSAGSGFESSS